MAKKTIQVNYFAILREKRGVSSEQCETEADFIAQFYKELNDKYDFPEIPLRVAKNNEFCRWDEDIHDGDVLVFIPPVAGG